MTPPRPTEPTPRRAQPEELLPFRPWMAALAVLMAIVLGVAIMEDLRAPRDMWAQNGR